MAVYGPDLLFKRVPHPRVQIVISYFLLSLSNLVEYLGNKVFGGEREIELN